LNSKNINGLFIQIVESLLIEKPANPVAFMIEYLYKQFPDQAKAAGVGPSAAAPAEYVNLFSIFARIDTFISGLRQKARLRQSLLPNQLRLPRRLIATVKRRRMRMMLPTFLLQLLLALNRSQEECLCLLNPWILAN
jgi:hypothetical protein